MTWFEANDHCKGKGAKLVEIDSEEENTALAEKINNRGYTDKNMNFWIGLPDVDNEGVWKLASDNSDATYLNWDSGQPNNGGGNEDCARLRMGRPEWKEKWSDLRCDKDRSSYNHYITLHALCEIENVSSTTTSTTTSTSTKTSTSTTTSYSISMSTEGA